MKAAALLSLNAPRPSGRAGTALCVAEVVKNGDVKAARDQLHHRVAANVPRAAGHENARPCSVPASTFSISAIKQRPRPHQKSKRELTLKFGDEPVHLRVQPAHYSVGNPIGFFDCQRHASAHMSSSVLVAVQPSTSRACGTASERVCESESESKREIKIYDR
jgi:hypothetical protein